LGLSGSPCQGGIDGTASGGGHVARWVQPDPDLAVHYRRSPFDIGIARQTWLYGDRNTGCERGSAKGKRRSLPSGNYARLNETDQENWRTDIHTAAEGRGRTEGGDGLGLKHPTPPFSVRAKTWALPHSPINPSIPDPAPKTSSVQSARLRRCRRPKRYNQTVEHLHALTPEQLARAEQRLLHPAPASRIAAARDFGIDLTLLLMQLRLSPAERVSQMLELCNQVEELTGRARR
jgi:hypothetical protein